MSEHLAPLFLFLFRRVVVVVSAVLAWVPSNFGQRKKKRRKKKKRMKRKMTMTRTRRVDVWELKEGKVMVRA